ncbi:MAG TPA: NUDIX domain-containing protein [Xanthobacteraceae bacterium]|nr:NUDIX domain-containing protein [Xanthobacteraceae bacterium]
MPKRSAGILLYQHRSDGIEVLLVHPGGPYWARKDVGAWSIPKGEIGEGEDALTAARREFQEETGTAVEGDAISLGEARQKSGKIICAFAIEGNLKADALVSNRFEMEWPPRSGRRASFPEVDRAEWFSPDAAMKKITSSQKVFVERLLTTLSSGSSR